MWIALEKDLSFFRINSICEPLLKEDLSFSQSQLLMWTTLEGLSSFRINSLCGLLLKKIFRKQVCRYSVAYCDVWSSQNSVWGGTFIEIYVFLKQWGCFEDTEPVCLARVGQVFSRVACLKREQKHCNQRCCCRFFAVEKKEKTREKEEIFHPLRAFRSIKI